MFGGKGQEDEIYKTVPGTKSDCELQGLGGSHSTVPSSCFHGGGGRAGSLSSGRDVVLYS